MADRKADLEQGEKQPLLSEAKASGRSTPRRGSANWHGRHLARLGTGFRELPSSVVSKFKENPEFSGNFWLSARGAFCCAVLLANPVLMSTLFGFYQHWFFQSISWVTCIIFMIFTLGPTVGASMSVAYQGMWGVFFASLNIVIMFGLFPEGTTLHPEPFSHYVWWIALADFAVWIVVVLFLNLALDFKLFFCCEHCWFMMCFFNPLNATEFSTGFAVHLSGAATSEFFSTFIGVNLAVLAAFLPYPVWERDRATTSALEMVETINNLWDLVMDYYTGQQSSALVMRLKREADGVHDKIVDFDNMISTMYWECFDLGRWGRVRYQLLELSDTLKRAHDCTLVAINFAEREEFEQAHLDMMKELEAEFKAFRATARRALHLAVSACLDGSLDAQEEQDLAAQAQELKVASASLAFSFSAVRTKICAARKLPRLSSDLLGEHAFVLSLSNFGHLTQDLCQQVLESKCNVRPGVGWMENPFAWDVLFTSTNFLFTIRNTLSIYLSFAIGFTGFPAGTHSLIHQYTSDIAVTTSLLLSAFAGSAFKKNLGRLQGVCLGTIIGQIIWAQYAWCSPFSMQVALTLAMFVYLCFTLYIYHAGGDEYGYIGSLLAVFGAKSMMTGCSDHENDEHLVAGKYNSLIYVTLAIIIMTLVDMVFAYKRASSMAIETLLQSSDLLHTNLDGFLNAEAKSCPDSLVYHDELRQKALLQAAEASKEPRLWRGPWHTEIMTAALTCHDNIRYSLLYLVRTMSETGRVGGDKSQVALEVLALPECKAVTQHILSRYVILFDAAEVVLSNEAPTNYPPKFFTELQYKKKLESSRIDALLQAAERIAGAESDRLLKRLDKDKDGRVDVSSLQGEEVYLHTFPICQVSVLVAELIQISESLAALEMTLVRHA